MEITFKQTTYIVDTEDKDFQKGDKLLQYYNCLGEEGWAIIEVKGDKEAKFHKLVSKTYKLLGEFECKQNKQEAEEWAQ